MNVLAQIVGVSIGGVSLFVCYAHADNTNTDPRLRWLDRLLEFLRPLTRYGELATWSDKQIRPGESWHALIQTQLDTAKVAVLLVSPAFLASDYIARSEVPVLLKQAKDRGLKILPVIISPCLYEETRFKYPDWKTGPHELLLGSLQSINPPSRTLVEMTEGEQSRVLLAVARQLEHWLEEENKQETACAEDRLEHQKQLKRQIEEASSVETSKHFIAGEICTLCGRSAESIAHFKEFRCSRTLEKPSSS